MAKRLSELRADLQKYLDRFEEAFNDKLASAVGFTVRQRMLQFISKGISPIKGNPRYEEYLAVTRGRRMKKDRKGKKLTRLQRIRATNQEKRGYPYNTKEFKRGTKRARPVNLWLTGEFLQALTFAFVKVAGKQRLSIGWIGDKKNALKEKGHREGAGGQPKRPTLPVGNEQFNQTIQLDIMKLLRDAVKNVAKVTK